MREIRMSAQGRTAASRRHFLSLCYYSLLPPGSATQSLCQLGRGGGPAPHLLKMGIKDNGDRDRIHTGHPRPVWQGRKGPYRQVN